jgi:hypothetical protein
VSRSSTRNSSGSFRAAARGVAGVFGTCFVPRVRKDETEEEREDSRGSRSSAGYSQGSRSAGFSQGSRSAGHHVSTDSGIIFLSSMLLLWFKYQIDQHENSLLEL